MTFRNAIRPAIAAAVIVLAAVAGTAIGSAGAAFADDGDRRFGGRHGHQLDRGHGDRAHRAPHVRPRPGGRYAWRHHHFRPRHWRHRHWHRRWQRFGHRPYSYAPRARILRTLIRAHGFYTVGAVDYLPPYHFKGYGPAYRDGAYVALAYKPHGAYRVHMNPYSGSVIQVTFLGRYR